MREEGSSTRARLYALCQANQVKTPKIALQFSGLNEALSAVTAGFGVNFVSSLVARDYIKRGLLARVYVQNVTAMNKIAICTRKKMSNQAHWFVNLLAIANRCLFKEHSTISKQLHLVKMNF